MNLWTCGQSWDHAVVGPLQKCSTPTQHLHGRVVCRGRLLPPCCVGDSDAVSQIAAGDGIFCSEQFLVHFQAKVEVSSVYKIVALLKNVVYKNCAKNLFLFMHKMEFGSKLRILNSLNIWQNTGKSGKLFNEACECWGLSYARSVRHSWPSSPGGQSCPPTLPIIVTITNARTDF